MPKKVIIFTHIPKTGGLTIRSIIQNNCKYYETSNTIDHLPLEVKYVYMHHKYGVHKSLNRPAHYFTFLRDPVNRVLSTYFFIKSRPNNRLYRLANQYSLKQFINEEHPDFHVPLNNHQTRILSGKFTPDLDLALKNINNDYFFIGITERFNESIFMLGKRLNWKNLHYKMLNTNKNRLKKNGIPDQLIQKIRKKNQLDYILYEQMQKRLQKKISTLTPKEKRKLNNFDNLMRREN
ncbi:sulfotransferase family 2 domain-containing protein [Bacillus carboniphilus]|uniref:Sulfotransferase family 2 domain-containing protein n=1 Tax=Bacillus carboniphilus TaxID=86663 RepID=A0ABY9JU73_9BACI|nr:sulfotransferase family 2 domain-containing protein [Bacillus carboniphilus]WLR42967.1 sulfotransferase family 2 domain-containing protein [Bacillus carboniphilus]